MTTQRANPQGVVFTVNEQDAGAQARLVNWFYPGETFGHQFVYSKQELEQTTKEGRGTASSSSDIAGGQ